MVLETIAALSSNPEVIKAATTGIATSLGKVAGESSIKFLGWGGGKFLNGMGFLTDQGRELLIPIAHKYIENYTERHGQLKVLGMGKPVSLKSVYTQVSFNENIIDTFRTIEKQETAYRDRAWNKQERQDGMTVANDNNTPYLMVLGGPGMGKSTFLRKVGLEALKQKKGEYNHTCIPVFLELRKYRWEKAVGINLEEKIAEEFKNCGLPKYQACTERLLEQGKLLILLDGLDEVPTDLLGQMTTAIRDLVDRYSENRFIVSCRVAAYRPYQNFSRFTDVAIASFDQGQIQYFIETWFASHDKPDWGGECRKKLLSDEHKATRELAQTPLLLTLICILFLKKGEFPTKRATLYDKALSTLLEEWDASKEIVRQQPYKGLDTKCKEEMLAEIAYKNFEIDNLFFQRGEISQQIEQVLREMLPNEQRINGKDVLLAVEEQHGLLVKRYEDIFSFSHLTIQEFLTAKHIVDNQLDISKLVQKYLCDKRWREVFLLLAGLRKADDLLLAMDREVRKYMNPPQLQGLLAWVEKVADPRSGDIQAVGKRAIIIANINAFAVADDNAITITKSNAMAIANISPYTYTFGLMLADQAIDYFIEYTKWAMELKIYQGLDLAAATSQAERQKTQTLFEQQTKEIRQNFDRQLVELFLATFHLTPEMLNLSKEEIKAFDNYLYGVRLMIECERAAVRRTPEVWSKIEERLLLP